MQPVKMLSMVLLFEDLRAHANSSQPPEGEEELSCPLRICVGVCGSLEALDLFHYSPVDVDGACSPPYFL
jgi:hypothetical protein